MKLNYLSEKLILKKGIHGNGIFSKEPINKNEIIAIFGGHTISREQEKNIPDKLLRMSIKIDDNFIIGPINSNELEDADFFNHSCNPNSGFNGDLKLIAMKDIKEGEEITFDYAMTSCLQFNCNCNSKDCRKIIKEDDWKNQELQKKYKGYFSAYIENKIDKCKKKVL